MSIRKHIIIGAFGFLFIVAATVFFWPKKSPFYVASPAYFIDTEIEYYKTERCDCLGIEKKHPYSMENFSSTWLCFGVYTNCHTYCFKIIHNENAMDIDSQIITCTEHDEAIRNN